MNSRGQSALEYLMTYGWALIVIAIVVGTLLMIIQPTYGFRCSTDGDLIMKDYSFPDRYASGNDISGRYNCGRFELWDGNLVVQNATGQTIEIIDGNTEGYFGIFNIGDHTCWPYWEGPTDIHFSENDPVEIKAGEIFHIGPYNSEIKRCSGALGVDPNMPKWFLGRTEIPLGGGIMMTCGSQTPYPGTDYGKIHLKYRTGTGLIKTTTITCNGWPEKLPN